MNRSLRIDIPKCKNLLILIYHRSRYFLSNDFIKSECTKQIDQTAVSLDDHSVTMSDRRYASQTVDVHIKFTSMKQKLKQLDKLTKISLIVLSQGR